MKLYETAPTIGVNQTERMNTKALNVSDATGYTSRTVSPEDCMKSFGCECDEIYENRTESMNLLLETQRCNSNLP